MTNYMVVYFPETLEFGIIRDERQSGYVGKRLSVTYDDRSVPYQGVVKAIYKTEEEASAMIDRCTNVDGSTLKYLKQRMQTIKEESQKLEIDERPNENQSAEDEIFERTTSEAIKNRAERRSQLVKKKKHS